MNQLIFYFLFLCCFAFGASYFFIESIYSKKILQPIIKKIFLFFKIKFLNEAYDEATICYGCIGFWAGILFSSVFRYEFVPISNLMFVLICGLMASGFSLFCNYLATYLLLQFQKGKKNNNE